MTKFRTHTGEIVTGDRLQSALKTVADWRKNHAEYMLNYKGYPEHVTEAMKQDAYARGVAESEKIRAGNVSNFTVWQRVNQELTSECVAGVL